MSGSGRPGGLTALAIMNFVLAAFLALHLLGVAMTLMMPESSLQVNEEQRQQIRESKAAMREPGFLVPTLVKVPATVLLLLSGAGYLMQKKWLGWVAGNVYALLDGGSSIATAILVDNVGAGGGFHLGMMAGILYPLFTLILINTTFRADLCN